MEAMLDEIKTWLDTGSINVFGMPFAGKDTQGGVLADLLEAELMGGGQILRNSIIPDHVKKIIDAGGLAPTDDYINIVLPYLKHEKFAGKPLILSSVGRWHGEEIGVLEAAKAANHPLKAVVLLEVDEKTARERHRLSAGQDRGQRADDALEVFASRLVEYRNKTLPVIDFYEKQGLLIRVDGSKHPPEVTEQILTALQARSA